MTSSCKVHGVGAAVEMGGPGEAAHCLVSAPPRCSWKSGAGGGCPQFPSLPWSTGAPKRGPTPGTGGCISPSPPYSPVSFLPVLHHPGQSRAFGNPAPIWLRVWQGGSPQRSGRWAPHPTPAADLVQTLRRRVTGEASEPLLRGPSL